MRFAIYTYVGDDSIKVFDRDLAKLPAPFIVSDFKPTGVYDVPTSSVFVIDHEAIRFGTLPIHRLNLPGSKDFIDPEQVTWSHPSIEARWEEGTYTDAD